MAFGGSIKLDGEKEYINALKNINSNLRTLSSEMRAVSNTYDKNDRSTEKMNATNKVASKQIEEQQQKIKLLKGALENSIEKTGESSDATKKWQLKLDEAEATLKQMEHSIDDYGDSTEEASEKSLKMGDIIKANLISDAIKGGLSALASGMKKIGEGVVSVVKQSVEAYGEYEQLVGGVETLFGDSANVVKEYANGAYATAGLSANDYMETITSFSASMIQSLGGDTQKAAEYSNQVVIAMSDNVNKMGTSFESVSNAISGFAKGNYTMLDNLKLGYGGTKTEMERLIADASKMTDIQNKLNVSVTEGDLSFANITSAISVMQESLGIAGATEQEAATTIQGSLSATKSAWQNLITGMGSADSDFETLCGNLVSSATNVVTNIMPIIQNVIEALPSVLEALLQAVIDLLPSFLESGGDIIQSLCDGITNNTESLLTTAGELINNLIQGLSENLPLLYETAIQLLMTIITTIVENLPTIYQTGIDILVNLVNGIAQAIPELIPTFINAILLVVETIINNLDQIIDSGINIIFALVDGIINALPTLIAKAPEIIIKLASAIFENLPKILAKGVELIGHLVKGIVQAIPQLIAQAPQIISSLVSALGDGIGKIVDVGKNIVRGLWQGIQSLASWLWDLVSGWISSIWDGILDFFGIESPSKKFKWAGKMLVEGLAGGLDENGDDAVNSALGMANRIMDTMTGLQEDMKVVSDDISNSIPTEFDSSVSAKINATTTMSTQDKMVNAFKIALKDVLDLNPTINVNNENHFLVDGKELAVSVNERLGVLV